MVDASPLGQLQRHYEQYLKAERGLAPATVTKYGGVLPWFLTERFGDGPLDLRALDVSTITTFVIHAHTMSPGHAKNMVTALRSICRFFWQRGAIDRDLAAVVPRLSDWRLATIPKYLRPEEVERLLQACDLQTAIGRRGHAMLLLLARLGLRAGEISALELDDIQWRSGEILVHSSKRLPQERHPLLTAVGEALSTIHGPQDPLHGGLVEHVWERAGLGKSREHGGFGEVDLGESLQAQIAEPSTQGRSVGRDRGSPKAMQRGEIVAQHRRRHRRRAAR